MRKTPSRLRLGSRGRHFGAEVWRMRWPLLVCLLVAFGREWGYLPRTSPVTVWLSGLAKLFLGVIAAHVFRQQAFPYIDLGAMRRRSDPSFGLTFLGVCLLYAAAMLAVAQALG